MGRRLQRCVLLDDDEVDRTSLIDALDDIFMKIQYKLVFIIDDL